MLQLDQTGCLTACSYVLVFTVNVRMSFSRKIPDRPPSIQGCCAGLLNLDEGVGARFRDAWPCAVPQSPRRAMNATVKIENKVDTT